MNSKSVLNRILTLLSMDKEVSLTEAQTKDGTILESPTFDVGEPVEVVSEDGTKTPAPDGEHEIALKDSEGNEVIIKVMTMDGKITERENVELEMPMDEEVVDKEAAIEEDLAAADMEKGEAKSLPNTTDEDIRNSLGEDDDAQEGDPVIRMAYRIDELEKKMKSMMEKMESAIPTTTPAPVVTMSEEDEDDEELPKLDGAPLEPNKFSSVNGVNNYGKKSESSQASFLSKLYN
jgi:hypothetical protein